MSTAESLTKDAEENLNFLTRETPPTGLVNADEWNDLCGDHVADQLECIKPHVAHWRGLWMDYDNERCTIALEWSLSEIARWSVPVMELPVAGKCYDPAELGDIRLELAERLERAAATLRKAGEPQTKGT